MFLLALTLMMVILGWQLFAKTSRETRTKTEGEKLVMAAQTGNIEEMKTLLAKGAEINSKQAYSDYTPLMAAVMSNQTEAVKLLLEKGADVNRQNESGQNALMQALM